MMLSTNVDVLSIGGRLKNPDQDTGESTINVSAGSNCMYESASTQ